MEVEDLVKRVNKQLAEAKEVNLHALRNSSEVADFKYLQGYIDCLDDMMRRLEDELKKLTRETLIDDDE